MALALRAGAVLRDLEFVQFHPTVMWLGDESRGQQPLISEAVRGEGAFLVDDEGVRFMQGQHELADLAPRDVVAKAIMRRMRETGAEHVWLDARHFGAEKWETRFPTILATCRSHGIDPVTELIPVAPACHYASGGVATDLHGRTSIPGLYAMRRGRLLRRARRQPAGLQLAARGPGLLAAHRRSCWPSGLPPRQEPAADDRRRGLVHESVLQRHPDDDDRAGRRAPQRDRPGASARPSSPRSPRRRPTRPNTEAWETTNLLTGRHRPRRGGPAARGDPRLALARGLPRARRRHWLGHIDVTTDGRPSPTAPECEQHELRSPVGAP